MSITKLKEWKREKALQAKRQRKKFLQSVSFPILYQDCAIVVINKTGGIRTIPDRWNVHYPNVRDILEKRLKTKVFVVHRLDKGTSGVMIFALTAESHQQLNEQFENRTVQKVYHALVEGQFPYDTLEIDIPLRSTAKGDKVYPSVLGKEAKTAVTVLERFHNATLVECELHTGRHHQIRAHLAAIGFPLLVDDVYGVRSELTYRDIVHSTKGSQQYDVHPLLSRLSLHSYRLTVHHPITGEQMEFVAEYPRDFQATVKMLRKYRSLRSEIGK